MERLEFTSGEREIKFIAHWWSQMMHLTTLVIQLVTGILGANGRNPPYICLDPNRILVSNNSLLEVFFSLPDHEKEVFAMKLVKTLRF
ncbi:hypothetical protein Droror1_Dr00017742 [Drosera rotundifolia]